MTPYAQLNQGDREILMRALAKAVDKALNVSVGEVCFTLLVFPEHEGKLANYISNGNRTDMIEALRAAADRLEKHEDMGPTPAGIQ